MLASEWHRKLLKLDSLIQTDIKKPSTFSSAGLYYICKQTNDTDKLRSLVCL
ncbi:hypothetical protein VCRA2116O29_60005 [Vibrio crassostreae]|nr:hypothetical protein VCRA2110O182_130065 [Vibrio crassostreae]CAK2261056.1 hypothetical protein VCRA2111O408_130065 [Vibrio crassostreae]CAK2280711.1 hypothetical protein VCRA211O406_120065 [Vibrio crassostreae]CAK2445762.1 hypothetical protein VCRA2119O48_230005 [Vibrio crassostreae]CAK2508744.1 hypothetical protein VCRA2113O415_40087 [Vibrio crassostreae]